MRRKKPGVLIAVVAYQLITTISSLLFSALFFMFAFTLTLPQVSTPPLPQLPTHLYKHYTIIEPADLKALITIVKFVAISVGFVIFIYSCLNILVIIKLLKGKKWARIFLICTLSTGILLSVIALIVYSQISKISLELIVSFLIGQFSPGTCLYILLKNQKVKDYFNVR